MDRKLILLFLNAAMSIAAGAHTAAAQKLVPNPQAMFCSGFIPAEQTWRVVGITLRFTTEDLCPPGHAFMSAAAGSRPNRPGNLIPIKGTCCPLPEGALIENDSDFYLTDCPEGFVATGARQEIPAPAGIQAEFNRELKNFGYWFESRQQYIRCTRLDAYRFMLGPKTDGINIGSGRHFSSYFARRTLRARIPPSMRYGIGRVGAAGWVDALCIGDTLGSVLVGKHSKHCSGLTFRQLQYAGIPGDPPTGSPVYAEPDCIYVGDVISKNPMCYKAGQ